MAQHGQANPRQNGPPVPQPDAEPFRDLAVMVEGRAMHAVASDGAADAPLLVAVHGLGLSHRYMMPVARALAADHRVYVPDLPGFGGSGHPERALDMAGLADSLARWMDAVGIGRAALLGNSQACQVIAHLAVRHPARVRCAVLQGPTTPPAERSWLQQFVRWRQNGRFNPPGMGAIAWSDYRRAGYLRVLRTFLYALRDPIEHQIPRIAAPILIVRGARDPICRLPWARELASRSPDGRYVEIPKVAHTLVFAAPDELAAVTRDFVRETAR